LFESPEGIFHVFAFHHLAASPIPGAVASAGHALSSGDEAAVDHGRCALVQHYNASGIAGYVACGSTAEAAALSEAEHDAALSTILSAAQGMPVVMGVSDCHLGMRWPAFRH
jgi:hypothetical protein